MLKPFVSLEECFKFRPRRVKCHLQKPPYCRITHFSAPRFVDLPLCFVDANANSCFCKNTCVLQWFLKVTKRCETSLQTCVFMKFRPSKNAVLSDNSLFGAAEFQLIHVFCGCDCDMSRHVISYCKSHMQITNRAPRLHETYGFEVRIHKSTFKNAVLSNNSFLKL